MLRNVGIGVLSVALVFGVAGRGSTTMENAAAWEAAAAYLVELPDGSNAIKGVRLKAKLEAGEAPFLLDVRESEEFTASHIQGAVNVPVREVPQALDKLPRDRNAPIVVICGDAVRSGYLTIALSFKGYTDVKALSAGYVAGWEQPGYPVVRAEYTRSYFKHSR